MAFYIQAVDSGLYLDVKGEHEAAGAEVNIYAFHGKRQQQWNYNNGMNFSKLNNNAFPYI
jgi:SRSO17 transposase